MQNEKFKNSATICFGVALMKVTHEYTHRLHSYNCAFDIRGTLEIFSPLKYERHAVPLNSPKFLQIILFKFLLHVRGFTFVTLKY